MQENFFLAMRALYEKTQLPDFAQNDIYLLIKYLSFDPGVFTIVEHANRFALTMSHQELIQYLFCMIPQRAQAPFLKLPKISKPVNDQLMKKVMEVFCCGRFHADQILSIYQQSHIDMNVQLGLK